MSQQIEFSFIFFNEKCFDARLGMWRRNYEHFYGFLENVFFLTCKFLYCKIEITNDICNLQKKVKKQFDFKQPKLQITSSEFEIWLIFSI